MPITGKQRAWLRGQAHRLHPVVLTGDGGISDEVIAKVNVELENHELLKVRVGEGPTETGEASELLVARTGAELVQVIGHVVVLYKRRKKDPTIRLPRATPA
jgi:RNA-binding protein